MSFHAAISILPQKTFTSLTSFTFFCTLQFSEIQSQTSAFAQPLLYSIIACILMSVARSMTKHCHLEIFLFIWVPSQIWIHYCAVWKIRTTWYHHYYENAVTLDKPISASFSTPTHPLLNHLAEAYTLLSDLGQIPLLL